MKVSSFLKPVTYNTVYYEFATKIYENMSHGKHKRTVRVIKVSDSKGYIIGECFKFDGIYTEGDKWGDEPDPPVFEHKKRIDFWIVAIHMNETVLVPKGEVEEFRVVTEFKDQDYFTWLEENKNIKIGEVVTDKSTF
jgi:hypothetical protein